MWVSSVELNVMVIPTCYIMPECIYEIREEEEEKKNINKDETFIS